MTRFSPSRLIALLLAASLAAPASAAPSVPSGAYLAARQASMTEDFPAAATAFDRLLEIAPDNPKFRESAVVAHVALGEMDRAQELAAALPETEPPHGIGALIGLLAAIRSGDYDTVVDRIDGGARYAAGADDLLRAWALFGAGRTDAALTAFGMSANRGGPADGFRRYNLALALVLADRRTDALGVLEGEARPAADMLALQAELLAEAGRTDEARALLDRALERGDSAVLRDLRARLASDAPVRFDRVRSADEAIGGLFHAVARAMADREPGTEALIHARIAQALAPRDAAIALLVADILETMQRHAMAAEAYRAVDPASPDFPDAEIGRASTLYAAGREEAATEVLDALARTHPELSAVHSARGTLLHRQDQYAEAARAFDAAIDRLPAGQPVPWRLYYARAVSEERAGNWSAAEADFNRALDIAPDQPDVLNYLGYSLVERGERLDEALDMIETAVAARPQAGHIVDSLGWALYRLGRHDAAVNPMERAVELLPDDPIVNDHLGDVYWTVGRKREARFQWRRALSFEPQADDAARIRAKLAKGLDAVLADEAGSPVVGNAD
jgi:tetratricopeptide (TPR) repeat protein